MAALDPSMPALPDPPTFPSNLILREKECLTAGPGVDHPVPCPSASSHYRSHVAQISTFSAFPTARAEGTWHSAGQWDVISWPEESVSCSGKRGSCGWSRLSPLGPALNTSKDDGACCHEGKAKADELLLSDFLLREKNKPLLFKPLPYVPCFLRLRAFLSSPHKIPGKASHWLQGGSCSRCGTDRGGRQWQDIDSWPPQSCSCHTGWLPRGRVGAVSRGGKWWQHSLQPRICGDNRPCSWPKLSSITSWNMEILACLSSRLFIGEVEGG